MSVGIAYSSLEDGISDGLLLVESAPRSQHVKSGRITHPSVAKLDSNPPYPTPFGSNTSFVALNLLSASIVLLSTGSASRNPDSKTGSNTHSVVAFKSKSPFFLRRNCCSSYCIETNTCVENSGM